MRHGCPHCEWPHFVPNYGTETARTGLLGLLFRKSGKVVMCSRCGEQFGISRDKGVYRIPGKGQPAANGGPPAPEGRTDKLKPQPAVDEDTAELWR